MSPSPRPSRLPFIAATTSVVVVAGVLLAAIPNTATAVEAPIATPTATPTATDVPAPTSEPTASTPVPVTPSAPAAPTASPKPTATPTPSVTPKPTPSTISVTYAGDSLTAMDGSWMRQMNDKTLKNIGGTAIGGATTPRILTRSSAKDADVLVVMAGTNDLRYAYSSKSIQQNIGKIVTKIGARHVVIAAIAPSNITKYGKKRIDRRKQGEILNRDLQNYALTHGYLFVDPWAADRQLNGGWPSSRTYDGVHPTVAMSKKVAVRMQQAIHIAVEGAKG
ncbi:lysophospholipase L1-like esterase [Curtobacterium sp. PhB142]|uniref:SGNH/GDSL hydrolase family protein n=1 Tax=unclassified Curtobacterium TaxID=257496 RepID=UPI0010E09D08|nr:MULTISPECIES: SGNH/GDSL hydrolase family protein [unclassified Curtobacterium]TCL87362.1 lysophospholipase L1-like esterase [Curtobacterium sp. PhB142]TCM05289.1 lysophospholipase L1-like esterase [Curtobacterium sp. PhB134]